MLNNSDRLRKIEIVEFFYILEHYCDIFDKCIEYGEKEFYNHIAMTEDLYSEPISDKDKPDVIDSLMVDSIREVCSFNRKIIPYLRSEPQSYRDFFISELVPQSIATLERTLSRENIEQTIYRFDIDPDSSHDVYKNFNCLYQILTNVESLIDDDKALKKLLNYHLIYDNSSGNYTDKELANADSDEQEARSDAFTWYGKPSELAALMSTLAENGYINAPVRDNNERNNEGFARKISAHFKLQNGVHRSLVNSLKDNTISPNNRFKIAMDKLPIKS